MWRQVTAERGREQRPRRSSPTRCATATRSSSSPPSWWPRARRASTVLAWLRDPDLLARDRARACSTRSGPAARRSRGGEDPQRRGRAAARRAALPARRVRRPVGDADEDDRSATGRRAVHELATSFEQERAAPPADRECAGHADWTAADPPRSRTTATPTCSSTRPRTSPRCSGGWSAAAAAARPGRSSATRPSRRGRTRREAAAARDAGACTTRTGTSSTSRRTTATPAEIFELRRAVRRAGRSRRRPPGGGPLDRHRADDHQVAPHERAAAVRSAVRDGLSACTGRAPCPTPVGGRRCLDRGRAGWRHLAVVAPDASSPTSATGSPATWARGRSPAAGAGDTKGLEFDSVVLVEPDADRGRVRHRASTLYVVLTRATRLLAVVQTSGRWRQASVTTSADDPAPCRARRAARPRGVGAHPDRRGDPRHGDRLGRRFATNGSPTSRWRTARRRGRTVDRLVACPSARSASAASRRTTTTRRWLVVETRIEQHLDLDEPARRASATPASSSPTAGGFEIQDDAYAELVGRIIRDEIGHGEGANLVIGRHYRAQLADWEPRAALAVLGRLLRARARRLLDLRASSPATAT